MRPIRAGVQNPVWNVSAFHQEMIERIMQHDVFLSTAGSSKGGSLKAAVPAGILAVSGALALERIDRRAGSVPERGAAAKCSGWKSQPTEMSG
jgi:hypothetical protein